MERPRDEVAGFVEGEGADEIWVNYQWKERALTTILRAAASGFASIRAVGGNTPALRTDLSSQPRHGILGIIIKYINPDTSRESHI